MEKFILLQKQFLSLPQNRNKMFKFKVIDGILYYKELWW